MRNLLNGLVSIIVNGMSLLTTVKEELLPSEANIDDLGYLIPSEPQVGSKVSTVNLAPCE